MNERMSIVASRLAVLVAILAAWQYLPTVEWLTDLSPLFDPFFVSSPSRVYEEIVELATSGEASMWNALATTLQATAIGVLVGTSGGALLGLILSGNRFASETLKPFIAALNATPRIALIPIFIIIAGPTMTTSVLTAVTVVFFVVFYNAFAGGQSVPVQVTQNAQLLGGTTRQIMRRVRWPYVMVWTFASIPNAISFGLLSVVAAELLTGQLGMGQLLARSITNVNSTLTFAVVVVLTVVGVVLVLASNAFSRRVLHWWQA